MQSQMAQMHSHYHVTSWLLLRGLALIYLLAITSMWWQIEGLIGSKGVLPANIFFDRVWTSLDLQGLWQCPSLLWLSSSDTTLHLICLLGTVIAIVAFIGFCEGYCFLALWVIYLSLTTAGQTFWSFQWDNLLLESSIIALFLCHWHWKPTNALHHPYHISGIWLMRFLLFKLMFLSGVVKLASRDEVWWNFTALNYHFYTQPLPPFTAWYIHHAPEFFLKASTFIMFLIELLFPFLIFAIGKFRKWRLIPFVGFIILMTIITFTGNYGFFNYLTALLCLCLLDDSMIPQKFKDWLPSHAKLTPLTSNPRPLQLLLTVLASILFLLHILEFTNASAWRHPLSSKIHSIMQPFRPFRSVNNYGLFANMTKSRPEILIEGSHDGITWKAYEFHWKPGALDRAPDFVAPYHPRLDWQMWFAALGHLDYNPWLVNLMIRIMQNSEPVIDLLKENPFPEKPPQYIRSQLYDYQFTSPEEKKATGHWWKQRYERSYSPIISQEMVQRE